MKAKLIIYSLGIAAALVSTVSAQSPPRSGGTVLPPPEAPFTGKIEKLAKDSTPSKIPVVKAPAGAPNVLIVLIDDCGFGQWGTFGGQVATPNLDKIARN